MREKGRNIKSTMILAAASTAGAEAVLTSAAEMLAGFESGKLIVATKASLASGETLKQTVTLQHSPDNSTWTSVVVADEVVVGTGASGGSANVYLTPIEFDFNRNALGLYIRSLVSPTFSASGTDTGIITATLLGGGHVENPVTRG